MRQVLEYHNVIGYRFIPSIKARIPHENGGYLIKTNSSGFRCKNEFINEKPENIFRIILFGDSYTAGDGVSNTKRYPEILDK